MKKMEVDKNKPFEGIFKVSDKFSSAKSYTLSNMRNRVNRRTEKNGCQGVTGVGLRKRGEHKRDAEAVATCG